MIVTQECTRCLFNSNDDPSITFNTEGVCSFCLDYDNRIAKRLIYKTQPKAIDELVAKIKKSGQGKPYDCIIGLSGGTDSTYVALLTKQLGLRPIAVHLDNGWNSELSVVNIQNTLDILELDLYTHVINWHEFRDLQRAYFYASVVDIEALTDQAISALLHQVAKKYNIKYVLSGENAETEGALPPSWVHIKSDIMNINDIHKRFGKLKLTTYPTLNYWKVLLNEYHPTFSSVPILNFIRYDKKTVQKEITEKLKWRDYGGKHYESVFTRFYQAYILPQKFGIDKRKSHLSTLICSGQLTKVEAKKLISEPICDEYLLREDKEYVVKKLGFTMEEFDRLMKEPRKEHTDYKSVLHLIQRFSAVKNFLKKMIPGN